MASWDDTRRVRKQNELPRPAEERRDQPGDELTNALLWLELAEGGTRDALVERLAQARLTVHVPRRSGIAGPKAPDEPRGD